MVVLVPVVRTNVVVPVEVTTRVEQTWQMVVVAVSVTVDVDVDPKVDSVGEPVDTDTKVEDPEGKDVDSEAVSKMLVPVLE